MKFAANLNRLSEDDRITMIGRSAKTQLVGVMLETNDPSDPKKIERYIRKITERFPDVRHVDTQPGITPSVSLVRFGPHAKN